ncbi:MAG: DUF72 domain-containing protein [Candidatus Obscuribacterales bacterium]|nr:DUF72 domain-containing protein [Candidatus Obscuribacterales bacterium]
MAEVAVSNFRIGCCGPGMSLAKYRAIFRVLEVQQTFYQPPRVQTLQKWRAGSDPDFEFAIKAWQLITHPATSPTYRRITRPLTDKEKGDAGSFRMTAIVKDALTVTYESAAALSAKSILFQCPKSFLPSAQNQARMRRFFSSIDRPQGVDFYFEPRGAWSPVLIRKLCVELNLFHAVDPLVNETTTPEKIYFRLHGVDGYRYQYTDEDLQKISQIVASKESGYVLFNNTAMIDDALRFKTKITGDLFSSSPLLQPHQ